MRVYKLENIPEFVEDPMIRDIRIEKERQLKKEEEDKIARKLFEKVILIILHMRYHIILFIFELYSNEKIFNFQRNKQKN